MPSGGDRSTRSSARGKVILLLSAALLPLAAWAGPRGDQCACRQRDTALHARRRNGDDHRGTVGASREGDTAV